MAKRTPRSQANETTNAPREPTLTPRARGPRQSSEPGAVSPQQARAEADAPQPAVSDAAMTNPHMAGPEETMPPAGNASAPDRTTSESMASEPSEEDIRLRAYHLFLERGGRHGAHEDDWHRAERELRGGKRGRK